MTYRQHVLPRLIAAAMASRVATELRAAHVPAARGAVLEVGFGSGLNLPFYTSAVTALYAVDPSAELLAMARDRIAAAPFPVVVFQQGAERLPLADAAVDTVVVTWALCSVPDPAAALAEMRRVLKPGGRLLFIEHGLAPDAGVRRWQRRLTPFWRRVAGGCHLDRNVDDLIRQAGFAITELRTTYAPGPRLFTFMYAGTGRRR